MEYQLFVQQVVLHALLLLPALVVSKDFLYQVLPVFNATPVVLPVLHRIPLNVYHVLQE